MTTGTQYDPENRKKEIVLQHPEICVVYGRLCVSQSVFLPVESSCLCLMPREN